LRALITSQAIAPTPTGLRSLATDLATLRSTRVTVSVPEVPILLPSHEAGEVLDVVRTALRNVEQHAGPHASAWVLLEHLGREVAVTVRDDGMASAKAVSLRRWPRDASGWPNRSVDASTRGRPMTGCRWSDAARCRGGTIRSCRRQEHSCLGRDRDRTVHRRPVERLADGCDGFGDRDAPRGVGVEHRV
jgi:hypothetical protein